MAVRPSPEVLLISFVFAACGDTKSSLSSSGGTSASGVTYGGATSGGGGAKPTSGGSVSDGGTVAVQGGGSATEGAVAGQAATANGGTAQAGGRESVGGVSAAGASAGQAAGAGTGGSVVKIAGGASNGGGAAGAAGGTSTTSSSGAGAGGGTTGGSGAGAGGSTDGGVPSGWIVADDVDYSMVPGPNFETVRAMFEGVPCSGSNCHNGGRNHLQVGKPADQLYSYMMSFNTLECGKLIDKAKPSNSALVKYLRGPCGQIERMPSYKCIEDSDEYCVPEYYIAAIEKWIENGAPR